MKAFEFQSTSKRPAPGRSVQGQSNTRRSSSRQKKNGILRLIAVFKLMKACTLLGVAIVSLKLIHSDLASDLGHLVGTFGLDPGNRHIDRVLQGAAHVTPDKMRDLGIGSLVYAALFLTEGIGLWLLKPWAEWFTVIITSSLVPVEVYELLRHPTPTKGGVLLINAAVVIYLIIHIRRERKDQREAVG